MTNDDLTPPADTNQPTMPADPSPQPWGPPPSGFGPAYGWSGDPYSGYSPYGPPPPPYAAYPPPPGGAPAGPPSKPARFAPLAIAVGVMIALASGAAGAGIGMALRQTSSTSTSSSSSLPSINQSVPSSSGSTSNSGSSTSGSIDATAIAAKIDPSIVDVVNTLAGNAGLAEGTGIIISSSGEILTNNHVIDGASSVTVQIDGQGPKLAATVLGYDPVDDVALLKINDTAGLHLTVAPLGNSSSVSVGDAIVALGNAEGAGGTPAVATGTVTGLDQSITASDGGSSESLSGLIQMNADIVPGDSGGPLVNSAGQVIGMDTAGATSGFSFGNQTAATQGFAIPIDTAYSIAQQIASGKSSGSIQVGAGPFIGVSVSAGSGVGAPVVGVESGSPAATAGLQAGDVINSLNGTAVTNSGNLTTALESLRPGDTVQIGWLDGSGQQHTASITLASGPPR